MRRQRSPLLGHRAKRIEKFLGGAQSYGLPVRKGAFSVVLIHTSASSLESCIKVLQV